MSLIASGVDAEPTAGAARVLSWPGSNPVGSLGVIAITSNGAVNPVTVVDDAAGAGAANSWSMLLTCTNANNSITTSIWVCKLTRALTASNLVTATYQTARQCHAAVLAGFDDVVTSTALDGQIATATASSDTPTVGPTGDPVAPRVLALFCVGSVGNGDFMTPLGGSTVIGAVRSGADSTVSTNNRFTGLAYQYVNDPGPLSASANIAGGQWNAGLGTIAVPTGLPPAAADLIFGSIAV